MPKALPPQTKASSIQYAEIVISRSTQLQSYDVVVSASGTTVIRSTEGDTNLSLVPDEKSKGAATTGQETNDGTDAARHHIDDTIIDKTRTRPPTDNKMVTGKDEKEKVATIDGAETSNASFLPTQTNSDDHKQFQPVESNESLQSVSPIQSLICNEEDSVNKAGTIKLTPVVQLTDISTDTTKNNYVGLVGPRRSSLPEGSRYSIVALHVM